MPYLSREGGRLPVNQELHEVSVAEFIFLGRECQAGAPRNSLPLDSSMDTPFEKSKEWACLNTP